MPKKEKLGRVVSDKMANTVVVEVPEYRPHPKYKKIIVQTKNYVAHSENGACAVGDEVKIVETRPISKTKRWSVAEVVRQAT